jgi:hypothetical protein
VVLQSIGRNIWSKLRNNRTQPEPNNRAQPEPREQTPLLGNRFGGRRGRNRLVISDGDRIELQPDVQS